MHRTCIGQIKRGEKNISFANLLKVASVLGVSMSELLTGLEEGTWPEGEQAVKPTKVKGSPNRTLEVSKLVNRLKVQRTAMDRTIEALERAAVETIKSQFKSG